DENKHWQRTFVIDVDTTGTKPMLLWDLSSDEHYKDPGSPVYRVLPNGEWVVRQDGGAIFLAGDGSSTEGDRPFLDRLDVKTRKSDRLFRSDKNAYEYFLSFADEHNLITWHQTPSDPPNAMLRTLGEPHAGAAAGEAIVSSTTRAITHIPDPTPAV